jgi:uncharacterized membrane protein YraQ (UPF0718 family)
MKFVKKNTFLVVSLLLLAVLTVIDVSYTETALTNTWNSLVSMLMIVPPIFILIGLFDVWVPKEQVIKMMGDSSGIKGMALAFFLGAFSAGPTIAAFPLAMIMLKNGASYANVLFFLMVWSSLKLPIVFFQITTIGLTLSMVINVVMLMVFIVSTLMVRGIFKQEERDAFVEKANQYV